MAAGPNYGGPYGSAFRATEPTWSQQSQTPTQYGYQTPSQHSSNFYVPQWSSQVPQAQSVQGAAASTCYADGSAYARSDGNQSTVSHGYGQPPGSAPNEYAPSSQPAIGSHWPFRAYQANEAQQQQATASDVQSFHAPQSVNPADVMPSQIQQQGTHRSARLPNETSYQQRDGSTGEVATSAQSRREAQHPYQNPIPGSRPSVQETHHLNANSSQHQQQSDEQYAHAQDDALGMSGQTSAQSAAGQKRKRSSQNATRPDMTPHSGVAMPPRFSRPLQGTENTRPFAGGDAPRGAAGSGYDPDASPAVETPSQGADTAQLSGVSRANATSTFQGVGGSQPPSSSGQTINNPASNARATWSQGPNYGRQRLNGKWLPRTVESPREQAQPSQSALATPGVDLLTPQQIEALQNANSEPQAADEVDDDEGPGANNETAPESDGDAREDVAEQDGHRDLRQGRWKTPTGPTLEEFGRKMNTLPGTIGSYLHYANMRVKYNPIADKLDDIREKLFILSKPVLLNSQQIADYWPHMTNIWMRSTKHDTDEFGVAQESWECRHRRRVVGKPRPSEGQGARHRLSKRQMIENAEPCTMRIRLTFYTKHADTEEDHKMGFGACKCIPEWLYLKRTEKIRFEQHNHDIDMLDRFRRSDGMMYFVKKKAEEGYAFSSVANWLHDKYDNVTKQAQFMTKQEVSNVAQGWRRANKGLELKMSVDDQTPEEIEKFKCMDLLNTTKPEGLLRALALVCERLPEAVTIAMPMLEASQEKNANSLAEQAAIVDGDHIVPPYPGFPKGRGHVPSPQPAPRRLPIPQTVESAADLQAQQGVDLRWRDVAVGGPSPLPPPQQKQRPPRGPPGMVAVIHTQHGMPGPAGPAAVQSTWQPSPMGQPSPTGRPHSTGVHEAPPNQAGSRAPASNGQAGPLLRYGTPPPPNMWHSGGVAYPGGPGPVQGYDAHGRPLHDSAHAQYPPGPQRPLLAPRPPSGSFFPHSGPPAGAPPPLMSSDPGTDEQTQRALAQAQTKRTFKPPYQAPAADSSQRQPPVRPSERYLHGASGGPYGRTVPFAPMGGEVHGNVNNPSDPDSWRPSWLQPIENGKDAKSEDEDAVGGALDPVARQLEDELGAHQGNVRLNGYDEKMATARERRSESEFRATTLANELETTTRVSALPAPQKIGLALSSPQPPPEESDEARRLRLQYSAAFKERERTAMPKTSLQRTENGARRFQRSGRDQQPGRPTSPGSTVPPDNDDDDDTQSHAEGHEDGDTIEVRHRRRSSAARDHAQQSSPANARNAAEMLTRLAQQGSGSDEEEGASAGPGHAAHGLRTANSPSRSRTRPSSPVVLVPTPKKSAKPGRREAESDDESDGSAGRYSTQSPSPEPGRTHEALTAAVPRGTGHPKSPADGTHSTPRTTSKPGHTPIDPAHSGNTGTRYARKLPPVGIYSLSPAEKPAKGAEKDTRLG